MPARICRGSLARGDGLAFADATCMVPTVPVRGPRDAAVVHRLLVIAHAVHRLLDASAKWDEPREPHDVLAVRVAAQCEPGPCIAAEFPRSLLCRKQTAHVVTSRLFARRLITPAAVDDARCRGFRLSEAGRRELAEADWLLQDVGRSALAALADRQRATFARALRDAEIALREALFELEVRWGSDFRRRRFRDRG